MAYASGGRLSSLAGLIGAGVGGYIGYTQAETVSELTPITGALILGGVGLVAGSACAFILKSLMQFLIYAIMFGVVIFVFQTQIEAMTGINPVDASIGVLRDIGLPVGAIPGVGGRRLATLIDRGDARVAAKPAAIIDPRRALGPIPPSVAIRVIL